MREMSERPEFLLFDIVSWICNFSEDPYPMIRNHELGVRIWGAKLTTDPVGSGSCLDTL
jgi:hypothetical protein